MTTRIRAAGISLALAVSAVAAAALFAPQTSAVDHPDGAIAEVAAERCDTGEAVPTPIGEDISDLLTDVTSHLFVPITPVFRFP